MKGVVLCGGHSSRMKKDKGLLLFRDKTWAQLAEEKLAALDLATIVSINPSQHTSYHIHFKAQQLTTDNAELVGMGGPLLGLMSVHLSLPSENLLALACDMPNMQVKILRELLNQFNETPGIQAICFKHQNKVEPLCAVYTASGLGKIFDIYQKKELKKNSMMYVLELLDAKYLVLKNEEISCFENFNSIADLN